ncbi:MAG: hypothetical protein ACOYIP_07975 [Coriobacteriales bacterium]|jgi:hypothetical protein
MSDYYGSRGSFRRNRNREDVDPMSSMANFGDVMLVFAAGLMTALVLAWNVDLASVSQVDVGDPTEMDYEALDQELNGEGSNYVQKGTVYQDPVTGKYYLVEE